MIFVTGAARSGTSLTTKILHAHGLRLGSGRVNSLFENVDVRENVLKPYLHLVGADPQGQDPLPSLAFKADMPGAIRRQAHRYLKDADVYKDAKLCLVWPVWSAAYPDAKWVIVRRDKDGIADSCMRTSFMHAFKDHLGWMKWAIEHEKRFAEMREALDVIEVWPQHFIDDADAFAPVAAFCNVEFDAQKVRDAIDRDKWR